MACGECERLRKEIDDLRDVIADYEDNGFVIMHGDNRIAAIRKFLGPGSRIQSARMLDILLEAKGGTVSNADMKDAIKSGAKNDKLVDVIRSHVRSGLRRNGYGKSLKTVFGVGSRIDEADCVAIQKAISHYE